MIVATKENPLLRRTVVLPSLEAGWFIFSVSGNGALPRQLDAVEFTLLERIDGDLRRALTQGICGG